MIRAIDRSREAVTTGRAGTRPQDARNCGEVAAIGEILPQLLARYGIPSGERMSRPRAELQSALAQERDEAELVCGAGV